MQNKRKNPHHVFLRRLQAGGRTNMYGAVPYLASAFTLSRDEAFRIVCEWIDLQAAAPPEPARAPAPVTPPAARPRRAGPRKSSSRQTKRGKPARGRRRAA